MCHRNRTYSTLLLALVALVSIVSCTGNGSDRSSSDASVPSLDPLQGEITVSAASSLTEAFTQIATGFKSLHPGAEVTFNFDSSSTLAQQVIDGAPVDVVAFADETNAAKLNDAGLLTNDPTAFAGNQLAMVTKPGNPTGIAALADLADGGVIALCAEEAPCGRFADEVLADADVTIAESRLSRAQNAKATLTSVAEGDAVAGIVYVTDANAAGDAVSTVAIPERDNVTAPYLTGVLSDASSPQIARAFVGYLLSDEAQAVMAEFGFLPPA